MASPRLEGRTGGVMAVRYDWRRTIAFIDQSGNETERARLRGLLGRTRPDARILRTLEALQNEDGGYPGELAQGRPSSVEATALVLGWMQDLSMFAFPQAQRAVTYLLTAQRPDGTWDESPGLLRYGPSPRLVPGDPRVQALCTALAACWLAFLGYRQDHGVARALAWLRSRQAADGRFLGFLRTTWAAAAVFRLVEGAGSSTSARAVEALTGVGDDRWYPGALAGMLACLAEAGVPASVPVMRRGLGRLWALARPDGSWSSEDGDAYTVEVTLGALRALLRCGAVSPPAIQEAPPAGAIET